MNQKKTCDRQFQIGRSTHGKGQNTCEERCSSDVNCRHYFFSDNGWCELHSSCDFTRTIGVYGTTFNKMEKKGNVASVNVYKLIQVLLNMYERRKTVMEVKLMNSY